MSTKNLIFIAAHNDQEQTLPHGIQSWRWYADKYGIDFHVSNKRIEADFKVGAHCAYEKWNESDILESEYDRILIIDSDVIVRWDTPNIFEIYPDINMGMVEDAGGSSTALYHFNQWSPKFNLDDVNKEKYCNSGVTLLSLSNYKLIHEEIQKYFEYWKYVHETNTSRIDAIDQTPVNIIGQKYCNGISIMDNTWNNMVMAKYDDASFINDSQVWHFTGPRLGGWGNKDRLMNHIWNHIKEQYK